MDFAIGTFEVLLVLAVKSKKSAAEAAAKARNARAGYLGRGAAFLSSFGIKLVHPLKSTYSICSPTDTTKWNVQTANCCEVHEENAAAGQKNASTL